MWLAIHGHVAIDTRMSDLPCVSLLISKTSSSVQKTTKVAWQTVIVTLVALFSLVSGLTNRAVISIVAFFTNPVLTTTPPNVIGRVVKRRWYRLLLVHLTLTLCRRIITIWSTCIAWSFSCGVGDTVPLYLNWDHCRSSSTRWSWGYHQYLPNNIPTWEN